MEWLGEGRTASVYADDDGRAVKLFHEDWSESDVEEVFVRGKAAERAGIPVVKAYGTVAAEGRYGIRMDRVDGKSVDILLGESAGAERSELIVTFAKTVRRIHDTHIVQSELPDQKNYARELLENLSNLGFDREEIDSIRRIMEAIPDGDGFIHGDCHTGNAFLQDGGILFSDLGAFTGRGDPVIDLCCMYSHYVFLPSLMDDAGVMAYIGMCREEGRQVYDEFMKSYYGGSCPIPEQSMAEITAARVCLAYSYCPGIFNERIVAEAKKVI